jgi:hypothetical protein
MPLLPSVCQANLTFGGGPLLDPERAVGVDARLGEVDDEHAGGIGLPSGPFLGGGSRCPAVRLPDPTVQEARMADHDIVVVGASAGGVEAAPAPTAMRVAAAEQATRRNL